MLTINGVTLPDPAECSWELQPQSSFAERNANGLLNRETLPDKQVLNCTWLHDEIGDFPALVDYLSGLTRQFIEVGFPHPDGSTHTFTAYISPLSATMLGCQQRYGCRWTELSCSFVER